MDQFLQAIANGDVTAIVSMISTFLSCGFGAALVGIFAKYKKYKTYTTSQIKDEIVKTLQPYVAEVVKQVSESSVAPIINNLQKITLNDKVLAESIALMMANKVEAVVNNISKIEDVSKEVIIQVNEKIAEQKAEEEAHQEVINQAIKTLEETKIDTL